MNSPISNLSQLAKKAGVDVPREHIEHSRRIIGGTAILARFCFTGDDSPYDKILRLKTSAGRKIDLYFKVR